MENEIRTSDHVLLVCTPKLVARAKGKCVLSSAFSSSFLTASPPHYYCNDILIPLFPADRNE